MNHKLPSILFVEDEPEVRFELGRFLRRYGREVIIATNGEEGLANFKEHSPDIVISDIKMPKMNGIDMVKEIKKLSPEQTIIFTTAHSDNNYFLDAIEMQVDGYILKPVDLALLQKKIADLSKNIELENQKKMYENILNDIAQMQDTMLAVYNEENTPIFYNKKLLTFLGFASLQDFLKKYKYLSNKFNKKEGCYSSENNNKHWIDDLNTIDDHKRIITMQGENIPKASIFLVSISTITEHNNIIIAFSEITSIIHENHQYKHEAYTDKLTQINNRSKFDIVFEEALNKSKKTQISLGIILLDIDNFKEVNDCYGHTTGDKVLQIFTKLIADNIRAEDSFSRWGGEEFAILLPGTSWEKAKHIAEDLRLCIEQYDFAINKTLTCSFGVTERLSHDTSQNLFERVDSALYEAKNKGRNRVIAKR